VTTPIFAIDPSGPVVDADGRSLGEGGLDEAYLPLALGLVLEQARAAAPAGTYRFDLPLVSGLRGLVAAVAREGPGVCLFSSYVWSVDANLAASKAAKRADARCLTIHGGPSTPNHPAASRAFLEKHRHVDVIVRAEGEATLADLLSRLPDVLSGPRRARDLALREIPGIVFLDEDGAAVRTPDREPIRDLDALPSPYLSGLFDRVLSQRRPGVAVPGVSHAALETNRGCPFGCTFCDWGSARTQKVRVFGLQRLRDEIAWLARHRTRDIFLADANFGMLPRDLDIAQIFADVKRQHGYPEGITAQYAKNGSRRLPEIFRVWQAAGLRFEAVIAMQTTDEQTLRVLNRANIKSARYVELSDTFHELKLPVRVHLMLGLPGQTVASWKNDLQFCLERQEAIMLFLTQVLPNSPMAEPEYMARHGIRTDESDMVVETSSFSRVDRQVMLRVVCGFLLYMSWGILRYVLMHLQWDRGIRMIDFVHDHVEDVFAHPGEHPEASRLLAPVFTMRPTVLSDEPPRQVMHLRRSGWGPFYAEVARFLDRRYGVARDSALDAILAAQEAVMPRAGAPVRSHVVLGHDVVSYVQRGVAAMLHGQAPGARLSEYPPGSLVVTDTRGFNSVHLTAYNAPVAGEDPRWELSSALDPRGQQAGDGRTDAPCPVPTGRSAP
jgi:radical SAM superfamily enzyme YgiQ (UPF0313 family)